jgi:hypothetical protein
VGKDVGKYINGSYVIEKTNFLVKPHLHTHYALEICRKLAIGRIAASDYIQSASKTESPSDNKSWEISKDWKRNSNTATYDFKNDNLRIK